jgi:ribosomal protein S18 acetylase RimI-like enzyme
VNGFVQHPQPIGIEGIEVMQAQASHLGTVLSILTEAGEWLAAKGIPMWGPGRFRAQVIASSIERGEVYLAMQGRWAIGTIALQWSDTVIWGDDAGDAAYVHRLAIRRAFAGKGLGFHLLRWAESAAAAQGKRYLRLDCMAENPVLREYYERAGFEYRGETCGEGWTAARYEKCLPLAALEQQRKG